LLAVVVHLSPTLASWLQYDRRLLADGQLWRLASCHFAHWNLDHLLWDTVVFAALGFVCERRSRIPFVACMLAAVLLIPLALWLAAPSVVSYRGLSGIDTAMFALLAGSILREKWTEGSWGWFFGCAALFGSMAAKIAFECVSGRALFVDAAAAEFSLVPLSHIGGAAVGAICGFGVCGFGVDVRVFDASSMERETV
jgi:rhomboid family GlyGly-CTERM serine protease